MNATSTSLRLCRAHSSSIATRLLTDAPINTSSSLQLGCASCARSSEVFTETSATDDTWRRALHGQPIRVAGVDFLQHLASGA